MLISMCIYVLNIVCAATGNMQSCPCQLVMQSSTLCFYERSGPSSQVKNIFIELLNDIYFFSISIVFSHSLLFHNLYNNLHNILASAQEKKFICNYFCI